MSNHRWCCCEGTGDCCDLQNCANWVAPNNVRIKYSGLLKRVLDTGQELATRQFLYEIESVGEWIAYGDDCTPNAPAKRFYCRDAKITISSTHNGYSPKNIAVDCECPPWCASPPWSYECAACIAPIMDGVTYSMSCECQPRDATYFVKTCTDDYNFEANVPGATSTDDMYSAVSLDCCWLKVQPPLGDRAALTLMCCPNCDANGGTALACSRPTVVFTPATNTPLPYPLRMLTPANSITATVYRIVSKCTPTPSQVLEASSWPIWAFGISAKCGCPVSWSQPLVWQTNLCSYLPNTWLGGYETGPYVVQYDPNLQPCHTETVESRCDPRMTCEGLPLGVCETGKLYFTGICYRGTAGSPPPAGGATVCDYAFSYEDKVAQFIDVFVT